MCEIKSGWRLVFAPMEAVTIHYDLSGNGTIRVSGGADAAYAPFSIIVVPARTAQSLGEAHAEQDETNAGEKCGMVADRLLKFTAGDGSRDSVVVCATISASYGGALGLFDNLRGPVVDSVSNNDMMRSLFAVMLAEIAAPTIGTQALIEAMMKQCLIMLLRRHLAELDVRSPFDKAMLQDVLSKKRDRPDVGVCRAALAPNGELVTVLDDFPIPDTWLEALVPNGRMQVGRIDALLRFLQENFLPEPPWSATRLTCDGNSGLRAKKPAFAPLTAIHDQFHIVAIQH